MQVDRLFRIVYLLLSRGSVTAGELAERFEVSRRTVYRDIEALSAAGVPVYAVKGKGGGIRLMDSFTMNRSLLSEEEQTEVLSALAGLRAAGATQTDDVLAKLSAVFNRDAGNWVSVDFSDWGAAAESKFSLLKTAILHRRVVRFQYFSASGEKTARDVEPLQLCFKHRAWYLSAYCHVRRENRFFKLSRIREPVLLEDQRAERVDDTGQPEALRIEAPYNIQITLLVDLSLAHRVYDEFDEREIQRTDKGFLVHTAYPVGEWVIGYILSFGGLAEVLEPVELRSQISRRLQAALERYATEQEK